MGPTARLGSMSTNSGAASGAQRARRVGKWLAKGCCSRTPHFFPRASSAAGHSAQRPCAAAFPSRSTCRGMASRHPRHNICAKYHAPCAAAPNASASAAHTSQVWGEQAAALWSTTWEITHWRARARACWRAAVLCAKQLGSRLSGRRSGQKAELCRSSGWPTPRLQGSQQTIDDGSISSYMVLPHAARPCAAMQHSCHPSDAMASPRRERLSGMGSQLRRHSTASWHVTPSSFTVAPIACALLPLRLGGAGTTYPSAWCSASLQCVRAVPSRPHRDGHGVGGVPWRLRSSERHAALSSESGQCLRCPQPTTTCRWQRCSSSQLTRRPAGCRCDEAMLLMCRLLASR